MNRWTIIPHIVVCTTEKQRATIQSWTGERTRAASAAAEWAVRKAFCSAMRKGKRGVRLPGGLTAIVRGTMNPSTGLRVTDSNADLSVLCQTDKLLERIVIVGWLPNRELRRMAGRGRNGPEAMRTRLRPASQMRSMQMRAGEKVAPGRVCGCRMLVIGGDRCVARSCEGPLYP
jgi:hypothetical protein